MEYSYNLRKYNYNVLYFWRLCEPTDTFIVYGVAYYIVRTIEFDELVVRLITTVEVQIKKW